MLNYGKRLLYDVVVPEPAAFLIDSLKKAAQPENFQLTQTDTAGRCNRAPSTSTNYEMLRRDCTG